MSNTPDNITGLEPNQIFVFGSNRDGLHAGGAAKTALERFGAVYGQGQGLQGQSYALPTIGYSGKALSLRSLEPDVSYFLYYARKHPELEFLLTKVGCGIAGHKEEDIAPLFSKASPNVIKPAGW